MGSTLSHHSHPFLFKADLNVVEGKYPSPHGKNYTGSPLPFAASYLQPEISRVGGAEGLGRVMDIKRNLPFNGKPKFQMGDVVVLAESGWGSWRSHLWVPSSSLLRMPQKVMAKAEANDGLNVPQASIISQVAGTAYRLLKDFAPPQPGEIVVQNAGTSAVSMCVGELMRIMYPESHLVSFVRRSEDDDNWEQLVNLLTRNCTTNHTVISEKSVLSALDDKQNWREWRDRNISGKNVVLGLNSVHGPHTSRLFFSLLSDNAKLVTYGAMSRQSLPVPAAPLIFKNVSINGYWHSKWMVANRASQNDQMCNRQAMLDELCAAVLQQGFSLPPIYSCDLSVASDGLHTIFDALPTSPLRAKLVWNASQ